MGGAPKEVIDLIERFERNIESYKGQGYNEAQVRKEFIDPFFDALGWDVANKGGIAEAYKYVINEDAIKIGGETKAPDYCFRIGGTRKFFLEAKKPAIDIGDSEESAYQLRRYAWSAKLPLSILTNFEKFAVYDCLVRPQHTERANTARTIYMTYKDYAERWDEIAAIFSKDAVLKGSFDKYAAKAEGKRGTSTVDKEFLKEIESWRKTLATRIAWQNRNLGTAEVSFAVQRIIDRILFLRMCEDWGIESYGQLMALKNGDNIYRRLGELFEKADTKYNSGLFYFKPEKGRNEPPDELTLGLDVPDEPISWILNNLYYPQPYDFRVFPAEILGNVYEQFLGKVIRITPGRMVKIDDKPEVKKAGGVYYTPEYIVNYIVQNTVGKLCKGKTPKEISKLKILDPACGSGSFLLGAYTYLLNCHRDWYVNDGPEKHTKHIYQGRGGQWYLTIKEKKQILLNNIYGVDIDFQAVEVTKLSLLLKVLEGENQETVGSEFKIHHERALPDLGDNIKCGNSLIGNDVYQTEEGEKLTEDERKRINAFDWEDGFPDVFKQGGFDAVIGNPPWGAEITKIEKEYLVKKFPLIPTKTKDSYLYFVLMELEILRREGSLGLIIPNTWLLINNTKEYRQYLLSFDIKEVIDYGDGVFKQCVVESSVLLLVKSKETTSKCRAVRFRKGSKVSDHVVDKNIWLADEYCRIIIDLDENKKRLQEKLYTKSSPFNKNCSIIWGIKPYQIGYGVPPQTKEIMTNRVYHSMVQKGKDWKPLVVGEDVNRYHVSFPGDRFIKYGKWLMYQSNESLMLNPKILMRQTSDIIRACYDENGYYCQNSLFIVHSTDINLKFLLGLLNSKLLTFVYKLGNPQTGKIFAEIKPSVIKELPIRTIDFGNPADKRQHDKMVKLVERMLDLNKKIGAVKVPTEKERLQREINATDKQIDTLVYDLYGLTEEEIAIVEGNK